MTKPELRAIIAESIATSYVVASDPAARIAGISAEDLQRWALAKINTDDGFRLALTASCDQIMSAAGAYSDSRINELLQDGKRTLNIDGGLTEVEYVGSKLRVTDILNGGALDVSDGAFVVFVDSRSLTTEALKKWQKLTNDDTRLMLIPLSVPEGKTVEQVVAAKRQADGGFTE